MKFKDWYEFNNKIKVFYLGNTFVGLLRKNSLSTQDMASIAKMSLKDINLFFGNYEIIFVNNYNSPDNGCGIIFGLYNPKKELDKASKL